MAETQEDKQRLIRGILDDAEKEAEKIRNDAERSIEDRKKSIEVSIKRAYQEAEERAEAQIREIEKQTEVAVSSARRRQELELQKEVGRYIESSVKKRLANLITDPQYENIIESWIVEAAIGLDVPEAAIRTTKAEAQIVEKIIGNAEKKVHELTGNEITLHLDTTSFETAQGVLLSDIEGKTAFNNQVSTRLLRYRSRIRTVIHRRLFKDKT